MRFLAQATTPPTSRSPYVRPVAIVLAGFLAFLAAVQLVAFDEFGAVVAASGPGITPALAPIAAALIVTAEVFALPFLLAMKISPLMRLVSAVFGAIVAVWWLFIALWQNLNSLSIANSGLFGAKLQVPSGWWMVVLMIVVVIAIDYVIRGTKFTMSKHQPRSSSKKS